MDPQEPVRNECEVIIWNQVMTSMGFEPLTSLYQCDALTN